MAISWGSWASGQSGSKSRLGVDQSITSNANTITVTLRVYLEFSGYYASSSGSLTFSGGHTGTVSVPLTFSGSGTRDLGTYQNAFSRPYGANGSGSTSISLSGFAGGSPKTSTAWTVPRRIYAAPVAPSSVTASRVSDTSADVSWAVPTSTGAPVESVEIIRQVNDGGWATSGASVAKANGTLRVTGQSRGNRYRWAVRGRNRDADGPYGYSGWVYQRPLDVGNVTATRSGNNIVVSWVDLNAVTYAGFKVFDNGSLVGTVAAGVTTWTHTAPNPAQTHRYSVVAYYGALEASPVFSETVQLLAPPLAPTILSPDGGWQVAATSITLSWAHNTVDGTAQAAYSLRVRKAGTTAWTTYSGTTTQSRAISAATFAGNGESIEWQVQTKGDHADYGPWSPVASFGLATRPTVTITAPTAGQTVTGPTVLVALSFSRAPISWNIEIVEVGTGTVVSQASNYTLNTTVQVLLSGLRNGRSYTVRAWATDKVQSMTQTRSITVAFSQPDPPTLTGQWDTIRGAVQLTVTPPAGGTPVPTSIRVERLDGTLIGTVSATGATILTDEYAPIHEAPSYRAISVATVSSETVESAPSDTLDMGLIPTPADFLNWEGNVVRVRYKPGLSRSPQATDLQLIDLDDGTADPVAIFGPKERHTTSLSGLLVDEPDLPARAQAEAFRALGAHKGLALLRSIDAPPVWGVVTGVGLPRELWGGYQVSLTHTKAR